MVWRGATQVIICIEFYNKVIIMPQIFQVLRCYKCLVFQVHQTKKSNKWECKLCGEKQSIKRHYGLGTAKDCRIHVQKLNNMRGEIDNLKSNSDTESDIISEDELTLNVKNNHQPMKNSKWSNYIEEPVTVDDNSNENNMSLGDAEVVLEIPKKQRKLHNNFSRNHKVITVKSQKKIQHNSKEDDASTDIVPMACDTLSTQIKISQPDIYSRNNTMNEESSEININTSENNCIPPVFNKNSKWAQFTEDAEEEPNISPVENIKMSQNDFMFSLCNDSDLDTVLNI